MWKVKKFVAADWVVVPKSSRLLEEAVVPDLKIVLAPKSLDFGAFLLGVRSFERAITLANTGKQAVTLSSASLALGKHFALFQFNPRTIKAGATAVVRVTFRPVLPGTVKDVLTLVVNGTEYRCILGGIGTPNAAFDPDAGDALTLDGSWLLDGSEDLDGVKN